MLRVRYWSLCSSCLLSAAFVCATERRVSVISFYFIFRHLCAVPCGPSERQLFKAYAEALATKCSQPATTFCGHDEKELVVHISLSKTVLLRRSDVTSFIDQLRQAVAAEAVFEAMLEGAQLFVNEDRSRSFVGVLPTAGSERLLSLLRTIDAVLADRNLPTFYDPPLLHASVAWAPGDVSRPDGDESGLAARSASNSSTSQAAGKKRRLESGCGNDGSLEAPDDLDLSEGGAGTQILVSAEEAAARLTGTGGFSSSSAAAAVATDTFVRWTIRDVRLRVGKEVFVIPLAQAGRRQGAG